jgi:hypothetical protein
VIALPQSAPPAISPLDLSAAAGIPAAAPKAAAGSHFQSILQAMSDTSERPKAKSAKKDSAADNTLAVAVPVQPQRTIAPPITLNIFPAGSQAEKSDGDNSEAGSTTGQPAATKKVADAPAQLRAAVWAEPRNKRDEPDPELPPAVEASAADGSLSKIAPAFEAHLQPVEPPESAPPPVVISKPDAPRPTKDNAAEPVEPPALSATDAAPGVTQAASSSSKHGDSSRHPDQDRPQETATAASHQTASAEAPQTRFDVNAAAAPAGSATSPARTASRSETAAASEAAPAPEPKPVAVSSAAHDIKLELNSGGQRVEVRLTERGGDIHVAVRTPDARLSGAMREDLPALTAKLEQSGFRTNAWQPGAAAGGERRAAEISTGSSSADSQEHSGQHSQHQQDDSQQQNPKHPTNAANRKTDRKDFAWLLQTYR